MTHADWQRPDSIILRNIFWEKTFKLRPNFSEDLSKKGMPLYQDWRDSINPAPTDYDIEKAVVEMAKLPTVDAFRHSFINLESTMCQKAHATASYSEFRNKLESFLTEFNLTAEWCAGYAERQLYYWANNSSALNFKNVFIPILPTPFSEEERRRIKLDIHFNARPPGDVTHHSRLDFLPFWEFSRWKSLISMLANLLTTDKRVSADERWRLLFILQPEFWIRHCINGRDDGLLMDIFRNSTPWVNFPYFNDREKALTPAWMTEDEARQYYYDCNPHEIPSALQFHFRDFWWIDKGEEKKHAEKRIEAKFKADLNKYLDYLGKEGLRPLYPEELDLMTEEEIAEMEVEQKPNLKPLHVEWAVRRIVPPIESKIKIDYRRGDHTKEIGEFSNSVASMLGLKILGSQRRRGRSIHH